MVLYICSPTYAVDRGRKIIVGGGLWAKSHKTLPETQLRKKKMGHGSNGKALA
jgi:hypothetical protein